MAILIIGASRCSICGEVLAQGQQIVATTHFISDRTDPLWQFSDSGMHSVCFAKWEHRDEFAARYHAALGHKLAGWVPAVLTNIAAPPRPRCTLLVLGTAEARAEHFAELGRAQSGV